MLKKECIVHIGMHKTGSSTIQEYLYNKFTNNEVGYFDLGSPNQGAPIIGLFSKKMHPTFKKLQFSKNDMNNYNIKTKEKFLQNINNSNKDRMILSGEGIIGLTQVELEDFKIFLNQYFETITIVAYIRMPKSYMESAFQEMVKNGIKNDFNLNVGGIYPRYRNKIEKFDFVFGSNNVKLWKFDSKSLKNKDVLADFFSNLGIDIHREETMRSNEALSREALSLIYCYRKHYPLESKRPGIIKENKKLVNVLKKIGGAKIRFSPLLINTILEKNKDDILWMQKRLGDNLKEFSVENKYDIKNESDLLRVKKEIIQQLYLNNNISIECIKSQGEYVSAKYVAEMVQEINMKINSKRTC